MLRYLLKPKCVSGSHNSKLNKSGKLKSKHKSDFVDLELEETSTSMNSTTSSSASGVARNKNVPSRDAYTDVYHQYVNDECIDPQAKVLVHKVSAQNDQDERTDRRRGEPPAKRVKVDLLDLSGKSQKKGSSRGSGKQTLLSRHFPSTSTTGSPSSSKEACLKSKSRDTSRLPKEASSSLQSSLETASSSDIAIKGKSNDPTLNMTPELKAMLMWQKIRAENLDCDYVKVFSKREADALFQECEETLTYYTGELAQVTVYGKRHDIPRKQVAHGDKDVTYTYSGVKVPAKPWTPVLRSIKEKIEQVTQYTFNFVLINRYEDGNHYMGEHRDDEKELRHAAPIASVSFGSTRDFVFRHADSRGRDPKRNIPPIKLQLEHGSLLLMKYPTNVYWYHALPVRKKAKLPRINLTFRDIITKETK